MPRFFDDYSNTYLTHDSAAGRKQQRRGWKFRENFKIYYQKHLDEWRSGPMGLAAAQQAYMRGRPQGDPSIPPLPEGWKEEVDDATKISYYVHDDGTRSWVRPNFFPPPPGQGGPPPGMRSGGPPPSFNRPPPPFQRGPPPPFGTGPPPPPNFPSGPPPPPMVSGVPPPQFTPPGAPPPQYLPPQT